MIRLGVIVFAAFIFFSGPIIPWRMGYFDESWGWADYEAKLRDPWLDLSKTHISSDQFSHLPKLNYRLTAPLLSRLLGLDAQGYVVLSGLACFITGCAFVSFGWRVTRDPVSAVCTGFLFAGLTAASQSVRSFTGHFDGLAYCFLALALAATRWPWIALATFLACWTDQRAALVSPIVVLIHALNVRREERSGWFELRRPACLGVVAGLLAWALTLGIALGLSHMKFRSEGVGAASVANTIQYAPRIVWGALEGAWILLLGGAVAAWRAGQKLLPLMIVGVVGLYLAATFATLDVSRSASYLIPAVAMAVALASISQPREVVRQRLYCAAAVSLLCPNFNIISLVYARTVEPLWLEALLTLRDLWMPLPPT
jgi:hypothetical protein